MSASNILEWTPEVGSPHPVKKGLYCQDVETLTKADVSGNVS